ncbi:MAG: DUF2239 family protein [Caulobacteraceae bacterium]|nr:DUF2239 family protein [Caulobacteraceae bacterium]
MSEPPERYSVFDGRRRIAAGSRADAALAVRRAELEGAAGPLLAFDSAGLQVDFDTRGSESEVLARLQPPAEPRGRGRPRLGVVAREVTLLPRHWEWLAAQPGGASVALRRLVEQARSSGEAARRTARDNAYRFAAAMAGDLPGFEEAMRALYAGDEPALAALLQAWPADIRDEIGVRLGGG